MIGKKIAIIGGGVSGLSAAYKLAKTHKDTSIYLYQANSHLGGRAIGKQTQIGGSKYTFDLGANLIDFQTEEKKQLLQKELPEGIMKKFKQFKFPFYLYEDGKLRKGDYQKDRYYYQGGFRALISDLKALSEKNTQYKTGFSVAQISLTQNKEKVKIMAEKGLERVCENYEEVYISSPSPSIRKVLSQNVEMNQAKKQVLQTKYNQQISVGCTTTQDMLQFSAILFVKHPVLTFMCSHKEKYGQRSIVLQTTEQFSKENMDNDDENLGQRLKESVPKQFKEWIKFDNMVVKKWQISTIKEAKNKKIHQDNNLEGKIKIIGDSIAGKARITNAIASGLEV